ncbi:MAG TPA: nitrate- and nitrite sensing domain-containing protein [Actinocrinis sp.]|nr:nitrate- and nitrite sensing domain-containing protein [Actinocrinis sp.]
MSDLRLRSRMVLLVLLPLTASVALAAVRVVSETNAIRAEDNLSGQVQVSGSIANLMHSLQDERDLIALYLAGGQQAATMKTLTAAESATDAQVRAFAAAQQKYSGAIGALSPVARALSVQTQARLGDLQVLRTSVVSLGDNRPVFQAYTVIINGLANFDDQLATGTTDPALGNLVSTLSQLRQTGEQTSQERGYLVGILAGGQTRELQEDLIQAQAKYNSAFAAFTAQAPAQSVNQYQATVAGQQTGATDIVVQQAIDAALTGRQVGNTGVDGPTAFAEATTKIGQIRSIEAQVDSNIRARTAALLSDARGQLYLNVAIIVSVLLLAFLATAVIARSIVGPLRLLRNSAYEIATVRLPEVIRRLRDADEVGRDIPVHPIEIDSADEIGEVARAFDEVHDAAVRLASEQAMMRDNVNNIFKNLSRRSQGLVERQLRLIDDLENSERDAGRLAQLFRLDHLATRMRRNNENLLVLAGEETARRWTEAVRLVDVARAAAAEVEQYERIMFGEMPRVRISGKAAPDVAHLVAELLENATAFSAPQTKVWVAARAGDGGGIVVHIEDVGIGMTEADLLRANDRLARPPLVDASVSRQMGLFVVGRLSGRYGIQVRLMQSQAGGISASILLPGSLVVTSPEDGRGPGYRSSDGPGTESVDEEFYALSRQLSQGARIGAPEGTGTGDISWFEYTPKDAREAQGERKLPRRLNGAFGGRNINSSGINKRAANNAPPDADDNAAAGRMQRYPGPANAGPVNPPPVNTGPLNNLPPINPGAVNAGPVNTGPLPTGPVNPGPITMGPMTTGPMNTGPMNPGPMSAGPISQAPPPAYTPAPQDTATSERLPIFEAVESEWFRRRGTRGPHSGWSPRPVQPLYDTGTQAAVQQQAPPPAAPAAPMAAPAPMPSVSPWASTGDDGWRAAAALAQPTLDGITPTGLPKRVPKANLVPGRAGGAGAAKASPPTGLGPSADAVRKRLSGFRRTAGQGQDAADGRS